ncbi:DNA recombination protein RmuC [Candidatus Saccharibacteria bacterium]|jgi:DNA recombination protein RmuC|nr:DNA recombination protein RmuC [Candidatus Saccharibacteria bacterium]
MDVWLVVVIIFCMALGFVALALVLLGRIKQLERSDTAQLLKADLTELNRSIVSMQERVGDKLEQGSVAMQTSMQKQLTQSAKLVADVSNRLTKLDETNARVVGVADELKTLQNVLQNPKQRGVFGEFYLESVLDNVLGPKQFQMQYKFKDGAIADAVIFLEKGRVLPIDSKFSLENYNRMVSTKDKEERARLLARVRSDLKGRIDETSKYIRPSEKTMDFAFMFIPSESLYYDLLIGDVGTGASARDLVEYAFMDKKVIIVSPTSFMAYLQTVLQGLRSLQIEQQAKEIQTRVGQLSRHIAMYEQLMHKLGGSLGTTVNHYNNAHKELKKIDKDIIKIADTDPGVEPILIDRPQKDD